jgi:phage gpG-like protein
MAEITVTLSPSLLSLPDRLRRTLDKSHEQSGRETVNELRQQTIQSGAIASFSFLRSIEKVYDRQGAIAAWRVGSALPYAPFVNYGRKPGRRPPVDAIVKWLALKPVDTGGKDIRQVAFAIATAIGKRGVKPKLFFEKTVEAMTPRIEEIFTDELERTISE